MPAVLRAARTLCRQQVQCTEEETGLNVYSRGPSSAPTGSSPDPLLLGKLAAQETCSLLLWESSSGSSCSPEAARGPPPSELYDSCEAVQTRGEPGWKERDGQTPQAGAGKSTPHSSGFFSGV